LIAETWVSWLTASESSQLSNIDSTVTTNLDATVASRLPKVWYDED
jgi:hypothetical protein